MSKLTVYNAKGKGVGKLSLGDDFVKGKVNKKVLYQVITNYLASQHRGTHKTKKRREVRGGGKKPWRQKGTGRARSGSIRNPLWTGGGAIFGPQVRSYTYSIPHKAKRLALLEAIKSKIQAENLVLFDKISLEKPKTKGMSSIIKSLGLKKKCLIVMEEPDGNVRLASRNIPHLNLKSRKDINALDVLRHDNLVISEEALKKIVGEK